jgi:hypothetical protein
MALDTRSSSQAHYAWPQEGVHLAVSDIQTLTVDVVDFGKCLWKMHWKEAWKSSYQLHPV